MSTPKKLIEVALPLDDINAASAREKSIRHGHPSTLHLWWARRPLATARAVIWASLVDDPSAHPEQFPDEASQKAERERLFGILRELVVWENSNNERVLDAAKAEIAKSCPEGAPALLDPFAGGGAIPLEAQRLGLKAYAQDLNPVAVTINKAMIEIPPLFAGHAAVNPEARGREGMQDWTGNAGLAADVAYYGTWMRDEAEARIGRLYPKVQLPAAMGGGEATVIAWLWARTVTCPNPACGGIVPLVRSFDLSKKKGKEHHVELRCEGGAVRFEVATGKATREGTVNRRGATCPHCGMPVGFDHIRAESREGRMCAQLMAIVAEGTHGRVYVAPYAEQIEAADVPEPDGCPQTDLPDEALGFRIQNYGLKRHKDLFTNRQLTALTTFSELVGEAQEKATADALAAGMPADGIGLDKDGCGARAYGEAIGVYLAFVVDQLTNQCSSICGWNAPNTQMRTVFARQAIPMTWDYAESNPFSNSSGCFNNLFNLVLQAFPNLAPQSSPIGSARQFDAQSDNGLRNIMISTDPPYYDNIGYADLSDYFYVWLRQSLRRTYPKLFGTMLVPKAEELVATPYRFDGSKERAKQFFEDGMLSTFKQVHEYARQDIPVTIYYAYKQSETDVRGAEAKTSSSGWETMLAAIIRAGFAITGTWPVHTEKPGRTRDVSSNALASSIVLVCRKRPEDAPIATRRELVAALRRELKPALGALQASNIAPVDLAQSAIGPGMGVYSRYARVLDTDGSEMGVRAALQLINDELDTYFNDQDDDLDRASRFCVELYTQAAFDEVPFGEADVLARAKNVSVEALAAVRVLASAKGKVHLLDRGELPDAPRSGERLVWLLTQQLVRALDDHGIEGCAQLAAQVTEIDAEDARALAYRLFNLADRKGWNAEAGLYNALIISWPDVQAQAAALRRSKPVQTAMVL